MASLVKANNTLANGGISVVSRNIATKRDGQITLQINYVCLEQYAATHIRNLKTGNAPLIPIPQELLTYQLNEPPKLIDLEAKTEKGLTHFAATYSAGTASDLIVTYSSSIRNISWQSGTSETPVTCGFDYVSVSVTVTGKNQDPTPIAGFTARVFNARNVDATKIVNNQIGNVRQQLLETYDRSYNATGEYTHSITSSGIYVAFDTLVQIPRQQAIQTASSQQNVPVYESISQRPQNTANTLTYSTSSLYKTLDAWGLNAGADIVTARRSIENLAARNGRRINWVA